MPRLGPSELTIRKRGYQQKYYQNNRMRRARTMLEYRRRVKQQVLDAYGNKCACCGEGTKEFLSIDHINEDGAKHKVNGRRVTGDNLYREIVRLDFPPMYRLLCYNCNCARGYFGYCPHEWERGGKINAD